MKHFSTHEKCHNETSKFSYAKDDLQRKVLGKELHIRKKKKLQ